MRNEDKKNNVIGIGHNTNQYSKEQYTKLVNSLHHAHKFAAQEMRRVRHLFNEALTKHTNSNPYQRKLKDFEVHERRNDAENIAGKFSTYSERYVKAIENKAKADGIELKGGTKEDEEESNG